MFYLYCKSPITSTNGLEGWITNDKPLTSQAPTSSFIKNAKSFSTWKEASRYCFEHFDRLEDYTKVIEILEIRTRIRQS